MQGVLYKRGVDGPVSLAHFLDAGLLENGDHGNMALREVYNGSSTAYTVSKLQPFTSYAFRLQVSPQKLISCRLEVLLQSFPI